MLSFISNETIIIASFTMWISQVWCYIILHFNGFFRSVIIQTIKSIDNICVSVSTYSISIKQTDRCHPIWIFPHLLIRVAREPLDKMSTEILFYRHFNLHFQVLNCIVRRKKTKNVIYTMNYFCIFSLC